MPNVRKRSIPQRSRKSSPWASSAAHCRARRCPCWSGWARGRRACSRRSRWRARAARRLAAPRAARVQRPACPGTAPATTPTPTPLHTAPHTSVYSPRHETRVTSRARAHQHYLFSVTLLASVRYSTYLQFEFEPGLVTRYSGKEVILINVKLIQIIALLCDIIDYKSCWHETDVMRSGKVVGIFTQFFWGQGDW